jgi:hypothetical protein
MCIVDARLVWAAENTGDRWGPSHNVTRVELCDSRLLVLERRPEDLKHHKWQGILRSCFIAFMLFGAQWYQFYIQDPAFCIVVGILIAAIITYITIWYEYARERYITYILDRKTNELTVIRHHGKKPSKVWQYSLNSCQGAIIEWEQMEQFQVKCRVVVCLEDDQVLPLTDDKILKQLPTVTIADTINEFLGVQPSIEG